MKLPWDCTRQEYFNQIAHPVVIDARPKKGETRSDYAFTMYRLDGIPKTLHIHRLAMDKAMYDRNIGHFWKIARQIERTENMKYLTPTNLVEYMGAWKKFFSERPHLQTSVVISRRQLW